MKKALAFPLLLLLSWPDTTSASPISHVPEVNVKNGTLVGTHLAQYNQDLFLGIPFAKAPVGELRYQHPQPITKSWGKRNATEYGAWCNSAPIGLLGFDEPGLTHKESEDCLFMNVVKPSHVSPSEKLPVLVWIYGGALQEGSSADQRYNMSFIVQESVKMGTPMIGVSFNYRVSGFGFMQGTAFNQSGLANLGLYDQRLALHWIQENIEAFGADKSRVTIAGESSGGISVGHQYLAFGGRDEGLFSAGIAESGGIMTSAPLVPLDQQDVLYGNVLNATNCTNATDTVACLRSVPEKDLKAVFQGITYNPVIDGAIIDRMPSTALLEGRFVKRPILIGSNTNEGTSFTVRQNTTLNNQADLWNFVHAYDPGHGLTPAFISDIVAAYTSELSAQEVRADLGTVLPAPNSTFGPLYGAATLYIADMLFNACRRLTLQAWGKHGVESYSYHFNAVPQGIDPHLLGAAHFQEVAFVFNNLEGVGYTQNPLKSDNLVITRMYRDLAALMSRMWISFVVTHSPNSHHVPTFNVNWPSYEHGAQNMVFQLRNSHLEHDVWRQNAIQKIANNFDLYRL